MHPKLKNFWIFPTNNGAWIELGCGWDRMLESSHLDVQKATDVRLEVQVMLAPLRIHRRDSSDKDKTHAEVCLPCLTQQQKQRLKKMPNEKPQATAKN
jgi:hypothetical protein